MPKFKILGVVLVKKNQCKTVCWSKFYCSVSLILVRRVLAPAGAGTGGIILTEGPDTFWLTQKKKEELLHINALAL